MPRIVSVFLMGTWTCFFKYSFIAMLIQSGGKGGKCGHSVCCLELEIIYVSLSLVFLSCLRFYQIYFPKKKLWHIERNEKRIFRLSKELNLMPHGSSDSSPPRRALSLFL